MSDLKQSVAQFLALKRIAVVGVSRSTDQPANLIYRKLKSSTRQVFAVNPNTDAAEGDRCYPNVGAIPGGVDGAVIVTTPAVACDVIDDCAKAGIHHVWLHRAFGAGSVSQDAIDRCRRQGLAVIPGACPMMYCDPVDPGHKCIRFFLGVTGKLPRPVAGL